MAISLPALLKYANFPPSEVDALMKDINLVTEEEKLDLVHTAWFLITQKYYARLDIERLNILEEVKHGKRTYNPNDIEEVKTKLLHELTHNLQASDTKESIEEVRQELEKYKTKPFVQDPSTTTPSKS